MITFNFIFARKHGQRNAYPIMVAFSEEGIPALLAKQAWIDSNAGKEFRDTHAEVWGGTFNNVSRTLLTHFHYDFPDPGQVRAQAEREAKMRAHRLAAEKAEADKALAAAQARAQQAAAAFEALSSEQKASVTPTPPPPVEDPAKSLAAKRDARARRLAESQRAAEKETEKLANAK